MLRPGEIYNVQLSSNNPLPYLPSVLENNTFCSKYVAEESSILLGKRKFTFFSDEKISPVISIDEKALVTVYADNIKCTTVNDQIPCLMNQDLILDDVICSTIESKKIKGGELVTASINNTGNINNSGLINTNNINVNTLTATSTISTTTKGGKIATDIVQVGTLPTGYVSQSGDICCQTLNNKYVVSIDPITNTVDKTTTFQNLISPSLFSTKIEMNDSTLQNKNQILFNNKTNLDKSPQFSIIQHDNSDTTAKLILGRYDCHDLYINEDGNVFTGTDFMCHGNTELKNNVLVYGDLQVNKNIVSSANLTCNGTLTVNGPTKFVNEVTTLNVKDLTCTGNTELRNVNVINEITNLNVKNITASQNINASNIVVNGTANFSGTFTSSGTSTFTSPLTSSNTFHCLNALNLNSTTLQSRNFITFSNNTNGYKISQIDDNGHNQFVLGRFNNNITYFDFTINGSNGAINILNNLSVSGPTDFLNNVMVTGLVDIANGLYMNNSLLQNSNVIRFNNNNPIYTSYAIQQIDNAREDFIRMGRYGFSDLMINAYGNLVIGNGNIRLNSSTLSNGNILSFNNNYAIQQYDNQGKDYLSIGRPGRSDLIIDNNGFTKIQLPPEVVFAYGYRDYLYFRKYYKISRDNRYNCIACYYCGGVPNTYVTQTMMSRWEEFWLGTLPPMWPSTIKPGRYYISFKLIVTNDNNEGGTIDDSELICGSDLPPDLVSPSPVEPLWLTDYFNSSNHVETRYQLANVANITTGRFLMTAAGGRKNLYLNFIYNVTPYTNLWFYFRQSSNIELTFHVDTNITFTPLL